jgi:YidC/Oxa1 family membrane protein insertase
LILHFAAIPLLGPISEFFAKILEFFNHFTGSFGWNVILLTTAFRIVVLPLSFKQTKSMISMQRLQPQLKEIQKKYKDDREKQGQEMMRLYKENKVSPLGGCLPLILQLPILFALFEVLRNAPKYIHYKTSFSFMGISNLVATGKTLWTGGKVYMPIVVLPGQHVTPAIEKGKLTVVAGGEYAAVIILILLTIITGYISSKMMTNDPKQAKMMALMPVIFGVFAWILPAGVTLYIITTNVLMVIQQYIQLEAEGFYDEKRALRLKTGDPLKWYERWRFKGYDYGSIVLTAVHIKKRAKPEDQKAPVKGEKPAPAAKAAAGKAAKQPAGKKPSGKTSGAPSGKKPGAKPAGKKPSGTKPAGKKPAGKKPVGKKPVEKKPDEPPVEKNVDTDPSWGHEPESAGEIQDNTVVPEEISRPQAPRVDKSRQYPAKKKGTKKK